MKRILISNWEESKKIQLELFKEGYKWFTDLKHGHTESELMLKSPKMIYPIFINLEKEMLLSWTSNDDLKTRLKKEFRKQKLMKIKSL